MQIREKEKTNETFTFLEGSDRTPVSVKRSRTKIRAGGVTKSILIQIAKKGAKNV